MHKKIDQRMEECNAVLKMYGAGVEMVDKVSELLQTSGGAISTVDMPFVLEPSR